MTDEEINDAVARVVMQWKRIENRYRCKEDTIDGGIWCDVEDFDPSFDIAQAFEVVQKMRERGWWVNMRSTLISWEVQFNHWDKELCREEVANTLPHAICLAALSAVESEGMK